MKNFYLNRIVTYRVAMNKNALPNLVDIWNREVEAAHKHRVPGPPQLKLLDHDPDFNSQVLFHVQRGELLMAQIVGPVEDD